MSFFLVLTPVSELEVGDWVMDENGGRSIVSIRRYKHGAYIVFNDGPSAWYHESELFPTERMA